MVTTTTAGWQLQGTAAAAYERWLVPTIFAPMAHRLVSLAGLGPGQRVLDVACGTGIVARTAAAVVGPTVVGLDVNPEMLAVAREASRPGEPAIEWRLGDVARLPLDDEGFDAVLCQQALQFFPDPVGALAEMRRVAVPGGTIAVSMLRGLDHHPVYAHVVAALHQHVGSAAAAMMASPFAFGGTSRCREVAETAGLQDVSVRIVIGQERFPTVRELLRREAASSPLAAELGTIERSRLDALVADLQERLADWVDDAGLVFANETHLVTARA